MVAVALTGTFARAADEGPGARHWNMKCGAADRSSRVTCEPIRRQPVEAWRISPPGGMLCEPVVWDGTVFLVSRDGEGRNVLYAHDASTGEERAKKVLLQSKTDKVSLLVWQGTVVMTEPDLLQGFLFKGATFKPMWKKKLTNVWRNPGLCRDILLVSDGGGFRGYDVRRGRDLEMRLSGKGLSCTSYDDEGNGYVMGVDGENHPDYVGHWIAPRLHQLSDLNKRIPQDDWHWGYDVYAARFSNEHEPKVGQSMIARMADRNGRKGWFVWNPTGFAGKDGSFHGLLMPEPGRTGSRGRAYNLGGLADARVWPAIYDGRAYTFSQTWDLLSIDVRGHYRTIVTSKDQPRSAWRGRPSIAQNVIYFGNWAVDLDSKRVLWVHKFTENIDLPAIPAGDGLLLVQTDSGKLICLADPDLGKTDTATAAEKPGAGPAPPLPQAMDGILLRDGTEVAGTVTQDEAGAFVVTPRAGKPRTIPADDVLVARSDGELLQSGTDREVFEVLRIGARAAAVRAYEKLFDQALRMELPNDAGKALELAQPWGMSGARTKALSAKLTGKRMHPNSDLRKKALARKQAENESVAAREIVAAARWCARRDLGTAAAGLLGLADRLDSDQKGLEELAKKTMPESFPYRDQPRGPRRWMRWAPHVLAAGAEFLAEDDPAWKRVSGVWSKDTIGFRTPHLLLFSRSDDVSAIGPCLHSGERAIEGLKALLDDGPVSTWDDDDRLNVRIHHDRQAYLAEKTRGGGAPRWSAGYYSPAENVSRFYVPEPGENPDALGRELFQVLAHELTHHYVDARWIPSFGTPPARSVATPGFWIVEGLARFIEDQMVDMETRGLTFDDHTAESIDATAQMAAKNDTIPLATLIDLTQMQFARLSDDTKCEVTLRRALVSFAMSPRSIFYEQSGALAFWLLRARGKKTRDLTIRYIRDFYTGKTTTKGWERLGFKSAKEMEAAFRVFLRQIR